MSLRLKMSVTSVHRSADSNGDISSEVINLQAVTATNTENAKWSKWTPSGTLSFTVNNPDAFGKVLPGQFYYVDLVPSTKEG